MIMGGRGRRLGEFADRPKIGKPGLLPDGLIIDLPTLVDKINEIDVNDINPKTLKSVDVIFNKLCTSQSAMVNILCDLHSKALNDVNFGEKFVVAFTPLFMLEVDNMSVRNKLLNLLQDDFSVKDTVSQSDPKKFLNSIILLADVFRTMRVSGSPCIVLGFALMEYFDMLIKGEEEEIKTLSKQIVLNGKIFLECTKLQEKYEQLNQLLRTTLITRSLTSLSRCWLLLALDFMSKDFSTLSGVIRDFYSSNLGDEYTKLESLVKDRNLKSPNSLSPPYSLTTNEKKSSRSKKTEYSQTINEGNRDLSERFSDINIKTEIGVFKGVNKKETFRSENTEAENWDEPNDTSFTRGNPISGHDDRFEKDENFYGVQMPRRPKPETKKKSNEYKNKSSPKEAS